MPCVCLRGASLLLWLRYCSNLAWREAKLEFFVILLSLYHPLRVRGITYVAWFCLTEGKLRINPIIILVPCWYGNSIWISLIHAVSLFVLILESCFIHDIALFPWLQLWGLICWQSHFASLYAKDPNPIWCHDPLSWYLFMVFLQFSY